MPSFQLLPGTLEETEAARNKQAEDERRAGIITMVRAVEEMTSKLRKEGIDTPTMDHLRKKGIVKDKRYSYGQISKSASKTLSEGDY